MINVHTSVEQKSLERQELETNLYSLGWFDGLIGSSPTQPENNSYWSGYSLGQREYWAKKLEVKRRQEAVGSRQEVDQKAGCLNLSNSPTNKTPATCPHSASVSCLQVPLPLALPEGLVTIPASQGAGGRV